MSSPIDVTTLSGPEPLPDGVPNHRASGELGDPTPPPNSAGKPRGLFSSGRKTGRAAPRTVVPKLPQSAKKELAKFYTFVGGMIKPFDEITGDVIMEQADDCAEAVFNLAQENDRFREALYSMMQTSLTMAIIMAHAPIVASIVARKSQDPRVKMGAMGVYMASRAEKNGPAFDLFAGEEDNDSAE
jgi:hypothetical protein